MARTEGGNKLEMKKIIVLIEACNRRFGILMSMTAVSAVLSLALSGFWWTQPAAPLHAVIGYLAVACGVLCGLSLLGSVLRLDRQ